MKSGATVNKYLNDLKNFKDENLRYPMKCADGAEFDVQAGLNWFGWPRQSVPAEYVYVEIASPAEEPLLDKYYVEKGKKYKFYPYVPVELMEEIIEKHGGLAPSE